MTHSFRHALWSSELQRHPLSQAMRSAAIKTHPRTHRLLPLRRLAYAGRSKVGYTRSYLLMRSLSYIGAQPAGVIHYTARRWPHEAYYAILLADGCTMEGAQWTQRSHEFDFYLNGSKLATLEEVQSTSASAPWWKRLLQGRREWNLRVEDYVIAHIAMQYPLGRGDVIPISLEFDGEWMVFVTSGLRKAVYTRQLPRRYQAGARLKNAECPIFRCRDLVIPKECRIPDWFSYLHFHLSVVFRTHFSHMDFG